MTFKPNSDFFGNIDVQLDTIISDIDFSSTANDIPGIKTYKTSNSFNLRQGQIIVLSGLIKHSSGKSITGIPGLKEIPVLGKLFQSQSFMEQRSQLFIFAKFESININTTDTTKI